MSEIMKNPVKVKIGDQCLTAIGKGLYSQVCQTNREDQKFKRVQNADTFTLLLPQK